MNAVMIEHADGRKFIRSGECDGCEREGVPTAQCCTYLALPLARPLSPDEQNWVGLHPGVSIKGTSVHIQVACSALVDGRCSLFGSPDRPAMCERFPELPEQELAGCAYSLMEI